MSTFWQNRRHTRVRTLLSSYIDGEVSASEARRVDAHLSGCDECVAELESLRATTTLLGRLPSLDTPRSYALTAADVQDLSRQRGFMPSIASLTGGLATAGAAALVVVLVVGVVFLARLGFTGSAAESIPQAAAPAPAAPAAIAQAPAAAAAPAARAAAPAPLLRRAQMPAAAAPQASCSHLAPAMAAPAAPAAQPTSAPAAAAMMAAPQPAPVPQAAAPAAPPESAAQKSETAVVIEVEMLAMVDADAEETATFEADICRSDGDCGGVHRFCAGDL